MPGTSSVRKISLLNTLPATCYAQMHTGPAGLDCTANTVPTDLSRIPVLLGTPAVVSGFEERLNTEDSSWDHFNTAGAGIPARVSDFSLWDSITGGIPLGRGPIGGFPAHACSVNGAVNAFTSVAPGFANGYWVEVFREPGGTLPDGLLEDTRYFVGDFTPPTFRLFADEDLTTVVDVGDGDCRVIRAVPYYINDEASITFPLGLLGFRAA